MQSHNNKSSGKHRPRYVLGGTVMEQHFAGPDTGTLFSLFENQAPASSRTPIHIHANDDETFYMLEGEMTAVIDGDKVVLHPAESILLQRNIPHQLLNESAAPARYLLLCTPCGFEGFLAEAGVPLEPSTVPMPTTSEDIQRMRNTAPRYGITILSEWPAKQFASPGKVE